MGFKNTGYIEKDDAGTAAYKDTGTEIGDVVVQGDKYVKSGNSVLYTPSEFIGQVTATSGVWGVVSEVIPNGYQSFVTITGTFYNGTRYNPFSIMFGVAVNTAGTLSAQNVLKSNKDIPFKLYKSTGSNKIKAIFELSSSFRYLRINVSSINVNVLGISDTLNCVATDSLVDYVEVVPTETKSLMNVGDFGFGGSPQNNDIDNTNITEVLIGASATSPFADGWGSTVFSLRGGSSAYHAEMAFSPAARYPKVRRRNPSGVWVNWVSLIDSESEQMINNKKVSFQNANDASPTVLDWYEEGTFTPTVIGSSVAGTCNYLSRVGRYTRIGNKVFFECSVNFEDHIGAGDIVILGLPFTAFLDGSQGASIAELNQIPISNEAPLASIAQTQLNLFLVSSTGVVNGLDIVSAGTIGISGHYTVA